MSLTFRISEAQILCIYCYDQNDSISDNVNNLLLNGGFENYNCAVINNLYFCPNSSLYNCDITNWTCTGGGISTYAHNYTSSNSIIVEGTYAVYFGNSICNACSAIIDDTSCLSNILCTVPGVPLGYPQNSPSYGGTNGLSLQQTVNGLVPGETYVLEFWVGGEYNIAFPNRSLFAVDVGFGNTFLRCSPTAPVTGIGTRYIIEFNATSTSQTIKFTNWGHSGNYCTELVIDDVRLYTLAQLSSSVPACIVGLNVMNENASATISPNPCTNKLSITVSSTEPLELFIYDITSRKLLQKQFTSSTTLYIEQLAKGIYIYEVRDKNGAIRNGKVMKE